MKKQYLLFFFISIIILPVHVFAGSSTPTETLRKHIDTVLAVLEEPSMKGNLSRETKIEKLRPIAQKMFDFTELSRRALGRNWNKLNAEQKREFVRLFRILLEGVYADRILSYTDEKVEYLDEKSLTKNRAEVQTHIVAVDKNIPVYYRMILKENEWRVYDVIVEGISITRNYRSQFREILIKQSPEELIDMLRKRVEKA